MAQQSYAAGYSIGFPGQRMGSEHQSRSVINDLGSSKQVDDLVITGTPVAQTQLLVTPAAPNNTTLYRVIINGVNIDYTTDGTATQAELRDNMLAAINASSQAPYVTATTATNDILVTSDTAGLPFTISIAAGPANPLTLGAATANTGTGTVYTFTINGIVVTYTGLPGDLTADIRDGLIAAGRAVPDLEALVNFQPSGNNVRVTAVQPGTGFTTAESDGRLSITNTTANVAGVPIKFGRAVVKRTGAGTTDQSVRLPSTTGQIFIGIAERSHSVIDPSAATTTGAVGPFRAFSACDHGDIVVETEEAIAYGDPVFFRHTAVAPQEVGMFRNDADTATCDQITGAMFVSSTTGAGLAVIKLK